MTNINEKNAGKAGEGSGAAMRPMAWLWPGLAGLGLALLILGLLLLVRPAVEKPAAVPIDPLAFQTENLTAIEDEIAALRDALALDPCAMPPLAGASPFPAPEPAADEATRPEAAGVAPETITDRVERATVMIMVESEEGLGTGSGFFVSSDLVLTNRHVIESGDGAADRIFVTNKALGGLVKARVVRSTKADELRDYALLSVSPPPGSGHSVLTLSAECKRTDRVSAWGYPYLFTQTDPQLDALMEGDAKAVPEVVYSAGVVSVIQDFHGLMLINHTAEVSPGSSGGPLINERGQVVGVNTMIRIDDESSRQVNVALGSGDIISFAAGLGLARPAR